MDNRVLLFLVKRSTVPSFSKIIQAKALFAFHITPFFLKSLTHYRHPESQVYHRNYRKFPIFLEALAALNIRLFEYHRHYSLKRTWDMFSFPLAYLQVHPYEE